MLKSAEFRFLELLLLFFVITVTFGSVVDRAREKRQSVDDLLDPQNIQNLLSRAIQDDGVVNPVLLFRELIEDPLLIPDFNISNSGTFSEIDGQFKQMKLYGLRQLEVKRVHINVAQMNASVEVLIPILRMEGLYNLDGTVTFFNVEGNGNFWMNVTDTVANGSASIKRFPDGRLEVNHVNVDVGVGDIDLHFENLMGGGSWSSISNTLLNQLSEMIFDQARDAILKELRTTLTREMNTQLQSVPSGFFASNESTTIFDDLLKKAGTELQQSGMDPMRLPNLGEAFSRKAAFVNVHGRLVLFNGTLYGLSSLRRTGDILLTYENNSVTLEASLGFGNITGSYGWNAHFMGVGPTGRTTLSIGRLSCYISIQQDLRKDSRPQILDLKVTRIGHIWLDVDGLGTLDFILEIFINIITNALKQHLADIIVQPVRIAVQHELDNLPVFLF